MKVLLFETLTGKLVGKFESYELAHSHWQCNMPPSAICSIAKLDELSPFFRNLRCNVRNYLMLATPSQLKKEIEISRERKDVWRAVFIQELMLETADAEKVLS